MFNKKDIAILLVGLSLVIFVIVTRVKKEPEDTFEKEISYIKNYEINEIIPVVMNEEQIARLYLSEFMKTYAKNPKESFEMLDFEYRESTFNTYESYLKFMKEKESTYYFISEITHIDVQLINGVKHIFIKDSNDNEFIFIEYNIWDFTVRFN